jgi:hypothetical protein
MKFAIKNNKLYFNSIPIINGELSFILVPIALIIFIKYDFLIKYLNYGLIIIAILGIIDTSIKYYINNKIYFMLIGSIFFHALLLYPLLKYKKYMKPNIINYILSSIGILIVLFLPYWPYELSRKIFVIFILLINIFFTCLWYLHHKH